jgi:hypothetical protein
MNMPDTKEHVARWGLQVTAVFLPLDGGGNRAAGAGHVME